MNKALAGFSSLLIAALTACGGGDANDNVVADGRNAADATVTFDAPVALPDAAPLEGCEGFDLPTTADDPLVVGGSAYQISTGGAVAVVGATLAAIQGTTPIATATSGAGGAYTLSIPTGGTPLDGYIRATATGLLETRVFAPSPLALNQNNVAALMLSSSNFDLINTLLLSETQVATNAWIGVAVLDASGAPVAGATVQTIPAAGAVHYNAGGIPNRTATVTDDDGVAFLINVPAGEVQVYATVAGTAMRTTTINATAGVINTVGVGPCSLGATAP